MAMTKDYLETNPGFDYVLNRSPGLRQRVFNPPKDRPIEIMPGLYSDDPLHIEFLRRCYDRFADDERWHAKNDPKTGLSLNFVTNDYQKIKTIAGTKIYPTGLSQDDNTDFRKSTNQPTDWLSQDDKDLFVELTLELFGKYTDSTFSLNSTSSTTIPDFASDSKTKKTLTANGIRYLLSDQPMDPESLIRNEIFPLYYIVHRSQPDRAGKVRENWDGYKFVKATPRHKVPGMSGMRIRTAYALSGSAAYPMIMAITPIRAYMLNEFSFSFKHRGTEEMVEKLDRFPTVVGFDVPNFDFSPGDFMLDTMCDVFEEYKIFSPRLVELIRLTLGGPSIGASPYPYGELRKWPTGPDPFDIKSYARTKGVLSGHPFVSEMGRLFCMFTIAHKLTMIGIPMRGKLNIWLKGKHPHTGILNSGDDSAMGVASVEVADKFFDTQSYLNIEKEDTTLYIGTILGRGEDGKLKGYPNFYSWLLKKFVPEHGLGKKHGDNRAYAGLGWREAKTHHSKHPMFAEFYSIVDGIFTDIHGVSMDAMMARHVDPVVPFTPKSEADRLFLINPDVIHYKVDKEDISPELLGLNRFFIPEEHTLALARSLYHEEFRDNYISMDQIKREKNVKD